MAEYIDRAEYCEKHCRCSNEYCNKESCPIWKAPAADVSPVVRGKWVHITRHNEGERMIATCSHCRDRGEVRSIRTEFGIWKIDSPRCPNCGARMDGGIVDG